MDSAEERRFVVAAGASEIKRSRRGSGKVGRTGGRRCGSATGWRDDTQDHHETGHPSIGEVDGDTERHERDAHDKTVSDRARFAVEKIHMSRLPCSPSCARLMPFSLVDILHSSRSARTMRAILHVACSVHRNIIRALFA